MKSTVAATALAACIMLASSGAHAATVVWTNQAGLWSAAENWSPNQTPGGGDDAVITNAGARVLLASSVTVNSLLLGGGVGFTNYLTFTNWDTTLTATGDVWLATNGWITLPPAFATNQMSNNVYIVCDDFALAPGGRILADACGWLSYSNPPGHGCGPGGASYATEEGAGAGHGGVGGESGNGGHRGGTYGSSNAPTRPGSGGGSGNTVGNRGGHGGGAIRIRAQGKATVQGLISANGGNAVSRSGGGSGGSVYIHCRTLAGPTNALMRADGGLRAGVGGGGGGGRVAFWVADHDFNGRATVIPELTGWPNAETGTVVVGYLPDPVAVPTNAWGSLYDLRTVVPTDTVQEVRALLWDRSQGTNTTQWTLSSAAPWLSVAPLSGSVDQGQTVELVFTNSAVGKTLGSHTGDVLLTATNATMRGVDPVTRILRFTMEVVEALPPVINSITSSTSDGTYNTGDTINVTVTFSEPVTLKGGTLDVSLDTGRTISITPFGPSATASGTYTVQAGDSSLDLDAVAVTWNTGVLTNAAGVTAWVALPATTIADGSAIQVRPLTVTLTSPADALTGLYPIPVTVSFNRDVTGLVLDDFVTSNAVAANLVGSGSNYTFNLYALGRGTVTATLPTARAEDAVGAPNALSSVFSRQYAHALTATIAPEGTGTLDGTNLWFNLLVTNQATAAAGYVFSQWSGPGVPLGSERANPLILTMDRPRIIQANFVTNAVTSRTWTGNGNWFSPTNWIPPGAPGPDDTAAITSGTVVISDPAWLRTLTVTNARVVFTNWTTSLNVGDLTLQSNAFVTTPQAFTPATMSNRVYIVCDNLTIDFGAWIDVSSNGWAGKYPGTGYGPGGGGSGGNESCGGGFGGVGGVGGGIKGPTYGSSNAPLLAGSAGGASTNNQAGFPGGSGGGAVRVSARGTVTVNGAIRANGQGLGSGLRRGGGSGGGVYITARSFLGGTTGALEANGGNNVGASGGGGGGRIAVWRSADAYAGSLSAIAGTAGAPVGSNGTVVVGALPDPAIQGVNVGGSGFTLLSQLLIETTTNVIVDLWEDGIDTNAMSWTLSTATPWIQLGVTSGVVLPNATNVVTLTNSAVGVASGVYTGQVFLTATNTTMRGVDPVERTITMIMTVLGAAAPEIVSITSVSTNGRYVTGDALDVTVTFSEPLTLAGGTLNVTLDTGAVVPIPPFVSASTASGVYTVQAGHASADLDAAGVALSGGAVLTNAAGTAALVSLPTVTIADGSDIVVNGLEVALSTPAGDPTGLMPIPVLVSFNRSVADFSLSDVLASNATASGFAGSGSNYTFNLNPAGRGTVWATIPANAAHDGLGVGNAAAPPLQRTFAYPLTVSVMPPGAGTVSGADTWYNLAVTNLAVTNAGYRFLQWSGTVPTGHNSDNPLEVVMDRPRFLQANFAATGAGTGRVWNGNGTWFTSTNWTPEGLPAAGDDVYLASGTCVLADPTTVGSLTVSNATLVATNWETKLTAAGAVVVMTNGLITHAGPNAPGTMSNRLWIVCGGLWIQRGGGVRANAKGWAGLANGYGFGPGGGGNFGDHEAGGGGHGGRGGGYTTFGGGTTYGQATNPILAGSAGGSSVLFQSSPGGAGGGIVRLDVGGSVTVDGWLTADGETAPVGRTGGGSGGAILVNCKRFDGFAAGAVYARGGDFYSAGSASGSGGGGRIAVYSEVPGSNALAITLAVSATNGFSAGWTGEIGTVYWGQKPVAKGSLFILR
jgi:hypothetical protein